MVKGQVTRENVTTQNFVAAFLALFVFYVRSLAQLRGCSGHKNPCSTHRGVY